MPSSACFPYLLLSSDKLGGWIDGYSSYTSLYFSSLSPALPMQQVFSKKSTHQTKNMVPGLLTTRDEVSPKISS